MRIDIGVYTAISVDFSEFDFTGYAKVIMTVKNEDCDEVLFTREYTEAKLYNDEITPEESLKLKPKAIYDFIGITTEGKAFKVSANGKIELREGVGRCR